MWFGGAEGGDTDFLVRRGYVHVCGNIRGTGKSDGGGTGEWDMYDLIEWIAKQPWCNGNVGMIGISAFGGAQFEAAAQQPPSLKAIFPYDSMGAYGQWGFRDFYPGGVIHTMVFFARRRRRLSRQSRPARPAHRRCRQALARGHEQSRPDDVFEHLQRHRGKRPDHAAGLRHRAQSLRSGRHRGKDQTKNVADQIPFLRGLRLVRLHLQAAPAGEPAMVSGSSSSPDRRTWSGRFIPSTMRSCAG